ncbi:MAG: sigma-70 family RNA polymerase sigma factor [Planctomycetota bacterium]
MSIGSIPAHDEASPENVAVIVARAGRGDQVAWAELIRLYARRVYAFGKSRLGDPEAAEELTQSVFATVAEKLPRQGYQEQGRFEAWLFRIAGNRLRDEMRRRKRRGTQVEIREEDASQTTADQRETSDELGALRAAIEKLPEADQQVVNMRHHAQLSFKQIAEILDEPVGTLLARHHRALKKLREMMETDTRSGKMTGSRS